MVGVWSSLTTLKAALVVEVVMVYVHVVVVVSATSVVNLAILLESVAFA